MAAVLAAQGLSRSFGHVMALNGADFDVEAGEVVAMIGDIRMGDVADFRNFMGAVIDRKAFDRLRGHLEQAKRDPGVEILAGGGTDDSVGYFVEPALLKVADPSYRLMCEEIFGPVLTAHVYPAKKWAETLGLVDRTGPYALTGCALRTLTGSAARGGTSPGSAATRSDPAPPPGPRPSPGRGGGPGNR